MPLLLKKIIRDDHPFLKEMLYDALFVADGEPPFPAAIVDSPEISKYICNWNSQADFGLIAQHDNESIGAVWGRSFDERNKGYGYIDAVTPEITIALKSNFRNKGIGTEMLDAFCRLAKEEGHHALSLSVDKRSRAVTFYERLGFSIVCEMGTAYTMIKQL